MTKQKKVALEAIKELQDYFKDFFHDSWSKELERMAEIIKFYPAPKKSLNTKTT
jgi:hypothetical protein